MGIELFIIGSLLAVAALFSIVGIAVGDIQAIRMHAATRLSKTSKRYRRPLVSVIVRDEVHDECITSIRHSSYRNKEIILAGEPIRGTLVLLPTSGHIFEPATIGDTVQQMIADPAQPAIEILRSYNTPRTLPELMRTYHDIIVAPFIAVRTALRITLPQTRWSVMIRPSVPRNVWRMRLYCSFRWLVASANILTLAYVCYVAAILYQSEYLQAYLAGFGIWLILAISRYPYFSRRQKLIYFVLAPVSFGYLMLLAFYAPFSPLVRRIRAATCGLVWQSSHQSLA